ncbi:MAG TPA: TetR/AcrR family transcriptional regulator [Micromonosporaceae bacterium]|nr:TetR/AcrR family transcriptional regulator [Micromonosporaceae bacterium]
MGDPKTRNRLLDAAWDVAGEVGTADLTLAAVAARAGVSRQAVYLHFGNRTTLLVEMARRADRSSGFTRRLSASRELPPREGFRRMLDEWYAHVPVILPTARALEAAATVGADGREAYTDRMTDWRAGVRVAVARLADAGQLAGGWDVDDATDWVWAQVHPATYHHLVAERGWPPEKAASTVIAVLERTLLR